jgi:radical SAM protein with 4Fe4S-binding SPASM domain
MALSYDPPIGCGSSESELVEGYLATLVRCGWTATAANVLTEMGKLGFAVNADLAAEVRAAAHDPYRRETDIAPHVPLGCLDSGVVLSSLHFATDLSAEQKRAAFKASVRQINVETSTQCNRRCAYCSNATNDRRSANVFMDDAVFERLVTELQSIDYNGLLTFVGYNEPLMHFENLEQRIAFARSRLPHARLTIFSNGDYLDSDMLKALEACGVDELYLTIHAPDYDECSAMQRMFDMAKKLELKPSIYKFVPGAKLELSLAGSKMGILIRHADMKRVGHNHGGGAPDAGVKIEDRRAPCGVSLISFNVGYTGNVYPCNVVVADIPQHDHCIMGNIKDTSIFDVFTGDKFIAWRRELLLDGRKGDPCSACPSFCHSTPENWSESVRQAIAVAAAADAGVLRTSAA